MSMESSKRSTETFTCSACGCIKSSREHGGYLAHTRKRLKKGLTLYCSYRCAGDSKKSPPLKITCYECGVTREAEGHDATNYRRSMARGAKSFCSKSCSGRHAVREFNGRLRGE